MACPHVAGLAALWWARTTKTVGSSASRVRSHLIANAQSAGFDPSVTLADMGAGLARAPAPLSAPNPPR